MQSEPARHAGEMWHALANHDFTPSLTLIANLADKSWSLTPELLYTGIANLDLSLRASFLHGSETSEFGEKQNQRRLELLARFYF